LPASPQQGEAQHDFALVAATALPAEETRRHIADARRIALPRTSEAAYAHLRRKLHGRASIEALRAWTEAEKARKLAQPDWIDVIIA
jgi:CelD/BcsL family acetyltransferase involved in cellulose biosynthesis